ncbi:MAG: hypothetical protein DCC75_11370 [Proteobacteria bacterium]|nr:MAG: hypothetical protein DCC75_11370 [Pseudomonadota bacterium]
MDALSNIKDTSKFKRRLACAMVLVWLACLVAPLLVASLCAILIKPSWGIFVLAVLPPILGTLALELAYESYRDFEVGSYSPEDQLSWRFKRLIIVAGAVLRYAFYLAALAAFATLSHVVVRYFETGYVLRPPLRSYESFPWILVLWLGVSLICFNRVCRSWPAFSDMDSFDIDAPPRRPMILLHYRGRGTN